MQAMKSKWSYALIIKVANQYKSKMAFRIGDPKAYQAAARYKLLDEIFGGSRWTDASVRAEAKKYKTRGAFRKGSIGAYQYARKHDVLDDLFLSEMEAREFIEI